MIEVKDIITILDGEGSNKDKEDAIITRLGNLDSLKAACFIWDIGLWNATHPRKGSTNNMRILDAVFRHYTDRG